MSIRFLSIDEISENIKKKELSILEIISQTKELFQKYDKDIFSAIEIFDEVQINKDSDENSKLFGIPCLIKDVICQKDRVSSCGSKILRNFKSPYNATAVERLHMDGAISFGRANCDEFAMGSSTETSFYGKTKNPWNFDCVPGGSSGGSAAAVSAGLVPFSLGTETGGSVRQPASFCNVVGLKPTYGLVSRYGVVAYASSLDQIGIFTRSVYENAQVLSSIAGKDEKDMTTSASFEKYDYCKKLQASSVKGKRIGVIENALNAYGVLPEIKELLKNALNIFEKEGATIEYVDLPTMEYSAAIYIIVSRAEAASNLSRFDGVKYGYRSKNYENLESMYCNTRAEGFGDNVKRRILIGNYVLSAGYADEYYKKAKEIQQLMRDEFENALEKYDVLFSPVSPSTAFNFGEINTNSLAIDLQDYFTCPANLIGVPALAVPCGFVSGLPVGFQIIGKRFSEELLFEIGYSYQNVTDFHLKRPDLERK
jgi:aspartyl-tRNA(Asn)/glutamyl-tRNA(Gln) amidotransferase subunit A